MKSYILGFVLFVLTGILQNSEADEVLAYEQFEDWHVTVRQDEWGDNREITVETKNLRIELKVDFGLLRQHFDFQNHRNYWPYCEVINITYKVDDKEPVRTRMGGDAANGGYCATIGLPDQMLTDMKKGLTMEVRSGYSDTDRVKVSLLGFSKAWQFAQKYRK